MVAILKYLLESAIVEVIRIALEYLIHILNSLHLTL